MLFPFFCTYDKIYPKNIHRYEREVHAFMDITMLGTGNAMVTECYNTCFVLRDGDKHLLVDGGGGNTLLAQLKHVGFDWMDMREIFVTHKHVDHIMGVVWMIRMICQHMKQGQYEGEATIYGHEEVIRILKEMAEMLYPKKQTCYIGDRLHLVVVEDGDIRRHSSTSSPPKRNSLASAWIWAMARNSPAVVTNHTTNARKNTPKTANGSFTKHSVSSTRQTDSTHTRNITPQPKTPANWQSSSAYRI